MNIDWSKVDAVAGGLTKEEYVHEALLILGADMYYDDVRIPQPTAGHFMLLEMMNNAFVKGGEITDDDIDIALFILVKGKKALGAVLEHHQFQHDIKNYVDEFKQEFDVYNQSIFKVFLHTYFKFSSNGFDMLPSFDDDVSEKKLIFDSTWLISYISICHKITGLSTDEIIWELPIITGGFCIAQMAKENGEKSIERQQDWKAILEEIKKQAEQNNE